MTDEERKDEGAEEEAEDLKAPAEAQVDVVGGAYLTLQQTRPTISPSMRPDCARRALPSAGCTV